MGDHAGRLDAASFLFLLCLFVFCCLFPFSLSCFLPVDLDLFLDLCSSFCWWFFDLFVALFRCVSCSAALYVVACVGCNALFVGDREVGARASEQGP